MTVEEQEVENAKLELEELLREGLEKEKRLQAAEELFETVFRMTEEECKIKNAEQDL